jgi:hypothetical protein
MSFMQLDKNQTKIRPGLSLHLVYRANDFEETNEMAICELFKLYKEMASLTFSHT